MTFLNFKESLMWFFSLKKPELPSLKKEEAEASFNTQKTWHTFLEIHDGMLECEWKYKN